MNGSLIRPRFRGTATIETDWLGRTTANVELHPDALQGAGYRAGEVLGAAGAAAAIAALGGLASLSAAIDNRLIWSRYWRAGGGGAPPSELAWAQFVGRGYRRTGLAWRARIVRFVGFAGLMVLFAGLTSLGEPSLRSKAFGGDAASVGVLVVALLVIGVVSVVSILPIELHFDAPGRRALREANAVDYLQAQTLRAATRRLVEGAVDDEAEGLVSIEKAALIKIREEQPVTLVLEVGRSGNGVPQTIRAVFPGQRECLASLRVTMDGLAAANGTGSHTAEAIEEATSRLSQAFRSDADHVVDQMWALVELSRDTRPTVSVVGLPIGDHEILLQSVSLGTQAARSTVFPAAFVNAVAGMVGMEAGPAPA